MRFWCLRRILIRLSKWKSPTYLGKISYWWPISYFLYWKWSWLIITFSYLALFWDLLLHYFLRNHQVLNILFFQYSPPDFIRPLLISSKMPDKQGMSNYIGTRLVSISNEKCAHIEFFLGIFMVRTHRNKSHSLAYLWLHLKVNESYIMGLNSQYN